MSLNRLFFQTAIEGEDVLLRCRVGNLQGRVQWTRNGFAMGKKNSFPFIDRNTFSTLA